MLSLMLLLTTQAIIIVSGIVMIIKMEHFFEPFVLKSLSTSIPFRFLDVEQAGDELSAARSHYCKLIIVESKLAAIDCLVYLGLIGPVEGQIAAQNDVHYDT